MKKDSPRARKIYVAVNGSAYPISVPLNDQNKDTKNSSSQQCASKAIVAAARMLARTAAALGEYSLLSIPVSQKTAGFLFNERVGA